MSTPPIRLTVRCPWRMHLEVDTDDRVRMKCRDCTRKAGHPVYHEITLRELRDRMGTITLTDSEVENHQKAA